MAVHLLPRQPDGLISANIRVTHPNAGRGSVTETLDAIQQPTVTPAAPPDSPGTRTRVAIVANPFSGAGKNRLIVSRLEAAIRQRGLEPRVLWDPEERATVLHDQQWASTCRCVIAAGGDGTVADAVNETRRIPIAMLPIGNENLFARQFGYRNVDQVADAVLRGRTRWIDLGRIGDRLFTVMASVGLDADVVERVTTWRARSDNLRRVTRLSYVRPALSALLRYTYPRVTLEADGRTVEGAHALVFNIPQYACRMPFTPDAEPDDGLLHWVVFEKPGALALAGYLAAVAAKQHRTLESVHTGVARNVRLASEASAPVQVDGDPCARTPVDIELAPAAVPIIVP
jgi:diacylglycerol kinase family enzyme